MSDADLYLAASKATVLADNGHTNVSDRPLYRRFNTIDAKLHWFADGLFLVRTAPKYGNLLGSRVIAIEDQPIEDLVLALNQYRGGAAQWRKLITPMMIESPEVLYAAGLTTAPAVIIGTFQLIAPTRSSQ